MKLKKMILLSVSILILAGCGNQEEKARSLYNKALATQRAGDIAEAKALYEEIIDKYPSTEIAVKVNEMLASREMVANIVSTKTKENYKKALEQAVKIYILDNGKCPSTEQGLQALVEPPTTGRPARGWRDGGYIENPSILDLVDSYSCGERGFKFTITMK